MEVTVPTRACEPVEEIAGICLEFGRLLMETGTTATDVEEVVAQVGNGLGAERIDLRLGYASLEITISIGPQIVTRMSKIGPISVNQRLYHALRSSATQINRGACTCGSARTQLDQILRHSPQHSKWIVAVSVGIACAAFGRLLAVDWIALIPIFIAACLAQLFRDQLRARHINVFLSAVLVAFLGSTVAGLGSRLAGSTTVARDMIVTVLLLVPGIPAFIAQLDILEGRPTLGSARAIWVLVILISMTAGVWLAQGVLRVGR
jgi:uncharacterized membrane protein YjjP (DUF1212 family)